MLRHSGAHILATAVRRLRPEAAIGFGPAIDDGFYYDFDVATPFTPEDLEAIEAEMRKVVAEKYPFVRDEVDRAEANVRFADDPLKLERIADLAEGEVISTYTDGPFIDLCRGPHVPDTSYLKHFKLLTMRPRLLAGRREAPDAAAHLRHGLFQEGRTRTAPLPARGGQKRDHRVLGKELDLFHVLPVCARRSLLDREGDGDHQYDQRVPSRAAT